MMANGSDRHPNEFVTVSVPVALMRYAVL